MGEEIKKKDGKNKLQSNSYQKLKSNIKKQARKKFFYIKSPGKSTVESPKSRAKLLQEKRKIKLLTKKEIKIACHGETGHRIVLKWKR